MEGDLFILTRQVAGLEQSLKEMGEKFEAFVDSQKVVDAKVNHELDKDYHRLTRHRDCLNTLQVEVETALNGTERIHPLEVDVLELQTKIAEMEPRLCRCGEGREVVSRAPSTVSELEYAEASPREYHTPPSDGENRLRLVPIHAPGILEEQPVASVELPEVSPPLVSP